MNFGLLKDPIFVVFLVSNCCTSIAFYIPIFCIPQHLEEMGMKSAGSTILLIYGIVNTLGRIIVGYISDKPFVNRLWVFNFSLVICGIGSAGVVACNQFSEFAICLSVYGITISAYVTLRSVILCDLFGLKRLESAFGLLLLFEGIATFVGHPIAGLLHNKYGSYNPAFWFAGAMIAFSGLILFALPQLQKYIEKRQLRCGVDHIENVIAT
ncbi:monocarboxylate transporter 10-like [Sitodiplosis mosellana]|uniref:monocarboxylate transporter 10-like n=1 Tax=Sitodiplosis mosellana TaxID=263140 RepID=UPI00244394B7|nr:monocarboxylate transporter 10-like [Sitodiplosis mosellana]